jgi:dihydrodipicolinate synthase/N-acetylneuraminate lyase
MTGWPRALPALLTPFTSSGDLDLGAHAHNVLAVRARGGAGILVAGSTGEGPYLEPGERRSLIRTTRETDPDMFVMCGVHAESLRQALAAVDECTEADATLVVTPTSLVRGDTRAVETFYLELAERSPAPLMLYSVPSVTAWELPTRSILVLAGHQDIVGMKDSGGNPQRISMLSGDIADGFVMYAGASRALAASAQAGAWGAITASGNYALADVSLAARGDAGSQKRLTDLSSVVEAHGVAGTKFAADSVGLVSGHMRLPLRDLSDTARDAITEALITHGLVSSQ